MKYRRVKNASGKAEIMNGILIGMLAVLLAFPVASASTGKNACFGVYFNGQLIGACATEEEARKAYLEARMAKNQDSMAMLDVNVEIGAAEARDKDLLTKEELQDVVYNKLDSYAVSADKQLAYTVKVNDFTVTLESKSAVLELLEMAQAEYDTKDEFTVALADSDTRESNVMTVVCESKSDEEVKTKKNEEAIVGLSFEQEIMVSETYVNQDAITDTKAAYADMTKQNEEEEIYEVKAGDSLSVIAENHNMTVDDLLAINPELSTDASIFIGDEITVMVPEKELSVVVSKQSTYEENFNAEIEYQDDENAYEGEETVIQEGEEGKRVVTAIVEYTDGIETGREIIKEKVKKEPVPKIVKRGTKSRPTYIKPLTNGRLTSGFGYRWGRLHAGVDWACPIGTSIRASRSGRVVSAGWSGGYGYCVLIDHGDGVRTRYAHLSKILVSSGQYVNQADKIALSGNTGRSTGPHLHFEIIVNGTPVNPLPYLD